MEFVLVHGTTQSPDGWGRLVDVLHCLGHRTHLVDLPRNQPDLLAYDYAVLAYEQIGKHLGEAPVLVGHSGAGVLLPELATVLGARHVLWVAAAIPDFVGGRSLRANIECYGSTMFDDEWRALTEPPTGEPIAAAHFLFHDCAFRTLRWAVTTLRLFYPDAAYRERPSPTLNVPSTYVLPTLDRTLRPDWMRDTARRQLLIEPVEIEAGHCPHVSRPDVLANILLSVCDQC